jgi:hypothetical protein
VSARRQALERAGRLYRAFREDSPREVKRLTVTIPKAVAVMGYCEFVGYLTTHRGKVALYIHEFAPGSRPLLCAGTGRGQLYLLGGRFKVTGRGITDQDASGRTVHAKRRYDVRLKRSRARRAS